MHDDKIYWVFLTTGSKKHTISRNLCTSPVAVRFCLRNSSKWKEGILYRNSVQIGVYDAKTGLSMTKKDKIKIVSSTHI